MELTKSQEQLLQLLKQDRELNLGEISHQLKVNRSSVFYQLKALEEQGLVKRIVQSPRRTYYKIASKRELKTYIEKRKKQLVDLLLASRVKKKSGKPILSFVDSYKMSKSYIKKLEKKFEVRTFPENSQFITDTSFLFRAKDADIIVVFYSIPITKEFLLQCRNLKTIVTATIVYKDYIDLPACKELGINVYSLPSENNYKIYARREFVFSALFSLLKPIHQSMMDVKVSRYEPASVEAYELRGKKVGIVGTKREGAEIVSLLRAFQAEIYIANPDNPDVDLSELGVGKTYTIRELFKMVDILIFPEEYDYPIDMGAFFSKQMRCRYFLFLSASVLYDIRKLRDLLISGHIQGLFIDYFFDIFNVHKNVSESSYRQIMHFPNVIITPEIGYYTKESIERNNKQLYEILKKLK